MTPFSAAEKLPRIQLPVKTCDCHMHVFDSTHEPVTGAIVRPPTATVSDYMLVQARLGTSRHVLVQPSTYGTDNSLMLAALEHQRECARGVAVIDNSISDGELQRMNEAGVVGIRFNQVQAGATEIAMLAPLASRISKLGWHVQLHLSGQQLIDHEQMLVSLHMTIVLDHYARIHCSPEIADTVRATLWRLMDSGNVWLKLSAPYLSSQSDGPPFEDLAQTVSALISDFPERLVWATDWPHATESEKPDDASLLDWFADIVPEVGIRQQIFVGNPSNLYAFG